MSRNIYIEKDAYFDSVFLMLISRSLQSVAGVRDAIVAMGTEMNVSLMRQMGFTLLDSEAVASNDLVIAIAADTAEIALLALQQAREMVYKRRRKYQNPESGMYRPVSLDKAAEMLPEANLVIISVPGAYAAEEARKSLNRGLHVMLFSDNVSVAEESELKKMALEKGLLLMGPDCGTAIIQGKPLGFANVVRRGSIGIIGASGTGIQELCSNIQRFGGGISQVIGTGGRDLQFREINGITTFMAIEALRKDPDTLVILVISKPPLADIAAQAIKNLGETGKPVVVHFLGHKPAAIPSNVFLADTLEEAAWIATLKAHGREESSEEIPLPGAAEMGMLVEKATQRMDHRQRYLRGLFMGGTLADEALMIFRNAGQEVHSNVPMDPLYMLKDPHVSKKHTIIDLGDDYFTRGKPHPMLDPSLRSERILQELGDHELSVLLLDFVLGYGSHEDPAGMAVPALVEGMRGFDARGGKLTVVASITGTEGDIQDLKSQREKLEEIGCLVMPSNAQAARTALAIIQGIRGAPSDECGKN